jgi:hypothetical protein
MNALDCPPSAGDVADYLGPADLFVVESAVAAVVEAYKQLRLAETMGRLSFREHLITTAATFSSSMKSSSMTISTSWLHAHLSAMVRAAFNHLDFNPSTNAFWSTGPRRQRLDAFVTEGVDRLDLVECLSMIVLYPNPAKTMNRLQSFGRGVGAEHLSELLLIGDLLTQLHDLDPHLQIAGPGLDALAQTYYDQDRSGSAELVSVVAELRDALKYLEKVQTLPAVS